MKPLFNWIYTRYCMNCVCEARYFYVNCEEIGANPKNLYGECNCGLFDLLP